MGRYKYSGHARLRLFVCALVFLCFRGIGSPAQQITLRARSNLVLVPTLVEDSAGGPVFDLTAKDFRVTDNGVPQKIHLDADSDHEPISIVVLVQTGGSALREFHKMAGLPTMVEALAGATRNRIAVVTFDSQPRELLDFSSSPAAVNQAFAAIEPGDDGAAIFDAVWYAVDMLQDEPPQNQRVIVLVSETRDHGSRTPIQNVIEKIGRANVVVYSLAFSPSRSDLSDFSHPSGGIELLPLVRMAVAALRKNAAAAIPRMTGGEYFRFNHQKDLDRQMGLLANQVHNRYLLSFQPSDPTPGLHRLKVELTEPIPARILARTSYWANGPQVSSVPEPASGGNSATPAAKSH
jgi:VWFA-related protein